VDPHACQLAEWFTAQHTEAKSDNGDLKESRVTYSSIIPGPALLRFKYCTSKHSMCPRGKLL